MHSPRAASAADVADVEQEANLITTSDIFPGGSHISKSIESDTHFDFQESSLEVSENYLRTRPVL